MFLWGEYIQYLFYVLLKVFLLFIFSCLQSYPLFQFETFLKPLYNNTKSRKFTSGLSRIETKKQTKYILVDTGFFLICWWMLATFGNTWIVVMEMIGIIVGCIQWSVVAVRGELLHPLRCSDTNIGNQTVQPVVCRGEEEKSLMDLYTWQAYKTSSSELYLHRTYQRFFVIFVFLMTSCGWLFCW